MYITEKLVLVRFVYAFEKSNLCPTRPLLFDKKKYKLILWNIIKI